jgi:hypothetical protein
MAIAVARAIVEWSNVGASDLVLKLGAGTGDYATRSSLDQRSISVADGERWT